MAFCYVLGGSYHRIRGRELSACMIEKSSTEIFFCSFLLSVHCICQLTVWFLYCMFCHNVKISSHKLSFEMFLWLLCVYWTRRDRCTYHHSELPPRVSCEGFFFLISNGSLVSYSCELEKIYPKFKLCIKAISIMIV